MTRLHAPITALLLALATGSGCGDSTRDPWPPKSSGAGLFLVGFRPSTELPPLHEIHSWTVELHRPDGSPVLGAAVTVDGGMPEHQHGLPTRPRMTRELGDGRYLVEGMKFSMGGRWVLEVRVEAGGTTDVASFELDLPQ